MSGLSTKERTSRRGPEHDAGHAVQVHEAVRRYGSLAALGGVSFDVAPGEFLVLLGPSGSGKSTLLRCLAGIERLSSGRVALSGSTVEDATRHVPPERRDLAMVFQDYALWPHLTARQNVAYAVRRRGADRAFARRRVMHALEQVGLADKPDRYPNELSGGEQQRVALARAVVAEPRLLLFDEPLSNLDAHLRDRLRVEISTVTRASHATAVYITHDQAEAFALADRIGVLDHGTMVQLDIPENIYSRPASAFVARFTGVSGTLHATARSTVDPSSELGTVGLQHSTLRVHAMGRWQTGDPVHLLVRPEAATIVEGPDGGAHSTGRVLDVAFRGNGYEHVIELPEGLVSGVHSHTAHPRGDTVGLRLDPAGCHATRADTDTEAPTAPTAPTVPTAPQDRTGDIG